MQTCGQPPASTAPEADAMEMTLEGPTDARSGEVYRASMRFKAKAGAGPVDLVVGRPSIVIIRDGQIVGKGHGGSRTIGFMVRPVAERDTLIETAGSLLACPTAPPAPTRYDDRANRALLPAGMYHVVGVVRASRVAGERVGQLVSEPLRIQVLRRSET